MTDQQKIYRVFRLLAILSQRPFRTVPHLASIIDCSKETIYKYIRLLESVGYQIDKDEGNRYFLLLDHDHKHPLLELEEAAFIQDILWQTPADNPLRDRILSMLNRQFTLRPLVQNLAKSQVYSHIQTISKALEGNLRLQLHNYLSGDNALSSRYCEPVQFVDGFTYLYAYDIDKQDYRQFKLDRIGHVELLREQIETTHESRTLDFFGWTGSTWLSVKLQLSNRARQLLIEEYPITRPYVGSHNGQSVFDGAVRDWRGIGRFILGLPGEITVLDPPELLDYLRERAGQGQWGREV